MKHGTAIEWTHIPGFKGETWNPIPAAGPEGGRVGWHCEHVSEGCRNCYAETMNAWRGTGLAFKPGNREAARLFLDETTLTEPLRWRAPRSIFVCSMSDLFGEFVNDDWIAFVLAIAALAPRHIFIVLTKRPQRMRTLLADEDFRRIVDSYVTEMADQHSDAHARHCGDPRATAPDLVDDDAWPLPNVWCGTSAEDQATLRDRQPALFQTPAARRFLSLEPLLGPIDVAPFLSFCPTHDFAGGFCVGPCPDRRRLDWLIAGGESGPKARPMHPDWPRGLRDQCAADGVPFFFKQWGAWLPWDLTAQAPFWESQAGHHEDGHVLFPADMDADNRWDDGLWAIPESEPVPFQRVGKRAAGDLLDGRRHHAWPELPR